MRLALDAMGGDDAPRAMVLGAVDFAISHPEHQVILVGRSDDIERELVREPVRPPNIAIEHAPEVIGMADKVKALREKPDDSMNTCARIVKAGKADALVLCGNTGCSVGAAQLHLRRVPGVERAGILVPLPNPNGYTWLCDGGANAECRPEWLVQFAEMTTVFLETVYGRKRPSVGVLSIGEEDEKGIALVQQARELLRKTPLHVVGNVEGHDIYSGEIDIVVTDGFTGNVVLKTSEGVAEGIRRILREEIMRSLRTRIAGRMLKPAFDGLRRRVDWRQVGGCPLIGVDGVCIIGHGRSDRVAVRHALIQAVRMVQSKLVEHLRTRFGHASSAA